MAQLNEQIVNRISFNANHDCFVCVTKSRIWIFNTNPLREISEIDMSMFGSIHLCEMLDRTNLLALVTKEESNIFQLYDDCKKKIKARITFDDLICGIRLRRNTMVVILRAKTHVYQLNYLNGILREPSPIFDYATFDNQMGLCEITRSDKSPLQLIVSPFVEKGSVYIMDTRKSKKNSYATKKFVAHKACIISMVLNFNSTMLATASQKGTIIRIWNTSTSTKIMEFRRGSDFANIYSMSFSPDSKYISSCSDKGTVHMYSISEISAWSKIRSYVDADRSVASVGIPSECMLTCAFIKSDLLVVVGFNGTFWKYTFRNNLCYLKEYEEFLGICRYRPKI